MLKIDYYFAKPYQSWQRGSNENMNGLIRLYFPKGMNFENMTDIQVQNAEDNSDQKVPHSLVYSNSNNNHTFLESLVAMKILFMYSTRGIMITRLLSILQNKKQVL